jgi:hypothetical protein
MKERHITIIFYSSSINIIYLSKSIEKLRIFFSSFFNCIFLFACFLPKKYRKRNPVQPCCAAGFCYCCQKKFDRVEKSSHSQRNKILCYIVYFFRYEKKKVCIKKKIINPKSPFSNHQKILRLIIFSSLNLNFKKLLFLRVYFFSIVFFSAKYNFLMLSKKLF